MNGREFKPEEVAIYSVSHVAGRPELGYYGPVSAQRKIPSLPKETRASRSLNAWLELKYELRKRAARMECNAIVSAEFIVDPFHGPNKDLLFYCVGTAALLEYQEGYMSWFSEMSVAL